LHGNQKEGIGNNMFETREETYLTPFHCEYPGCSMFTDEGHDYQGKKYCVDCFKKVKKETTNVKTNDKR